MRSILLLLLLLPAFPAHAERLTVVELYTSQGCSSCPPADALLAQLARTDAHILALGLHVTYWDRLGWKDPYSLPEATARQRAASPRLQRDYVYTPQMIVDGWQQAVGSDPAEVARSLAIAKSAAAPEIPLRLTTEGTSLHLAAGSGAGRGTLLLVGFDPEHTTPVRAGENGGRTLHEVNVVRSLVTAARWDGTQIDLHPARPAGERVAAILQSEDGRVLGAALLP